MTNSVSVKDDALIIEWYFYSVSDENDRGWKKRVDAVRLSAINTIIHVEGPKGGNKGWALLGNDTSQERRVVNTNLQGQPETVNKNILISFDSGYNDLMLEVLKLIPDLKVRTIYSREGTLF